MLYYYDPTQRKVINGAATYDGGSTYEIKTALSDGIAVSAYYKSVMTSSSARYNWIPWLVVPTTYDIKKKSFQVVETGLFLLPRFAD